MPFLVTIAHVCGKPYVSAMPLTHILVALLVALIWGMTFVVIQVGLESFPPLLMSALRFLVTGWPFLLFYRSPGVAWRYVFGAAFFFGICQFSFLFVGMDLGMPAGLSSLVLQVQAFFTVLFAILLLGDRPTARQWLGMLVAFGGIAVIALDVGQSGGQAGTLTGLVLVILAAASWGAFNIVIKKAAPPDLLRFVVWAASLPPVPLLALSWFWEGEDRVMAAVLGLDWLGAACVVYLALAATTGGFGLWGWLLKHHPASRVAPVSLLVPVFGMSLAAFLLEESFGPLKVAGAALVAIGLALNLMVRKRPSALPPAGPPTA
ncbi:MAG: EamA family transporter [Rhodospirillales bacterium]